MAGSERQEELIETHRAIQEAELPYILIGGWAVSAFQPRLTMDVDMVIPSSALDEYERVLDGLGFEKELDPDVSNIYDGRMIQFEKQVGENSIAFDALVAAVRCRQTDAKWSYEYLEKHSVRKPLKIAPGLESRIPEPALLFALKLHSGRRADARDLVVIGSSVDWENIERHVHRGDLGQLRGNIDQVLAEIQKDQFRDSFHGVFRQDELDESDVDNLESFLDELREAL
ncbi:MAG: hypothetical protein ABEH59_02565 [Halobacteriales archaeon]